MATCRCFRCGKGFESLNEDDIEGDGKCKDCTELSKKAALKVDVEIGNMRRKGIPTKSRIRQMFSEDEILKGDTAGASRRIGIRDLGITPLD